MKWSFSSMITFAHPCEIITIGNDGSCNGRTVVSTPTNEHHTCTLHVPFSTKIVLIFSWSNLYLFVLVINFAMIHFIDIFTFNILSAINRISTIHLNGVIRGHTWKKFRRNGQQGFIFCSLTIMISRIHCLDILTKCIDFNNSCWFWIHWNVTIISRHCFRRLWMLEEKTYMFDSTMTCVEETVSSRKREERIVSNIQRKSCVCLYTHRYKHAS